MFLHLRYCKAVGVIRSMDELFRELEGKYFLFGNSRIKANASNGQKVLDDESPSDLEVRRPDFG